MSRDREEDDDEDEFGGIDDDDLISAAGQLERSSISPIKATSPSRYGLSRPSKRRRLNGDSVITPKLVTRSPALPHGSGAVHTPVNGRAVQLAGNPENVQYKPGTQSEKRFNTHAVVAEVGGPGSCPPKTRWTQAQSSVLAETSAASKDYRKEQRRPGSDEFGGSFTAIEEPPKTFESTFPREILAERTEVAQSQGAWFNGARVTPAASRSTSFVDEGDASLEDNASRRPPALVSQRSMNAAGNLRQTTLFGTSVQNNGNPGHDVRSNTQSQVRANEPRTHHRLDDNALGTWIYPTNLGAIRDYQYNIVQKGLFHNLLVALPTGLGKTFIAATIMLNWFRWTTQSQIVFVAPTKPLVAQQIDACFKIVGIPRSQTTLLTGATPPGLRAEEWVKKRVFFMTPQTMINDLKTGVCDPKRIVCVVVDEAHRATGGYAYVEVIKFIRRFNQSFRVLALTATPGSTVEAVQEVIDGLDISRVEIRTEESLDIRQYVHRRNIETALFEPSEDIDSMKELFSKTLQPILNELNRANAYWVKDPMSLTAFGLTQARRQWMNSDVGRRANPGLKGKMHAIFALLASLAHATTLLNFHGIGPFYQYLAGFRGEGNSEKTSKYRKQVLDSPHFQNLMTQARQWRNQPDFVGHPKLSFLREVVLNHFLDADSANRASVASPQQATRTMVFVQYRDSADEIVRVLKQNEPMVRPHVFVGQAVAKGSAGMNQKTQLEVIEKFKKGTYNTLVATCVGEEGLDIGEVDLIICYDSSSSPIRMLQRMGRTGRKRAGNIFLLLMRGKEEDSYVKAKDAYEKMQEMIANGSRFNFHDDLSPRILPKETQPVVEKKSIEIPIENSQGDLPEPQRRGRIPKRPPKKFHMPDGVETGFITASRLRDGGSGDADADVEAFLQDTAEVELELVDVPTSEDVLLTVAEERELQNRYQYIHDDDGNQVIAFPSLDANPSLQRSLRPTKLVPHSTLTSRTVKMLNAMHNTDQARVSELQANLRPEDREMAPRKSQLTPSAGVLNRQDRHSTRQLPKSLFHSSSIRTSFTDNHPTSSASSQEGSDHNSEDNNDMDDFVVDDDVEEVASSSVDSSLPASQITRQPFYRSPQRKGQADEEAENDLPDLSVLVGGKSDVLPSSPVGESSGLESSRPVDTRRRKRPLVTDSSSDDDE